MHIREGYNKFIMAKKKVTIEDLAGMTQRGFEGVDKRFEGVDKRFAQADSKIESFRTEVNQRFDHIENLLIRAHENRIEKLEDDVRILKTLVEK